MKRLRTFLLALGLAAALAVGQYAVASHSLMHAAEHLAEHDCTPAPASCDNHGLYAAATSAAVGAAPIAPYVAAFAPASSSRHAAVASLPPRYAFHPRGPPASPA